MSDEAPAQAPIHAEQTCPIGPAVDVVFSRWTTPILWTLHQRGRLRFLELQKDVGRITSKVLTQRLRQMERDGLVRRIHHAEIPPRVEYEITDLGLSLAPVFATLGEWSAANLDRVEQARREFDAAASRERAERR